MRPWKWTATRTEAASLVFIDELTDLEIAAKLGICKVTLETWKKAPAFREKIEEYQRAATKVLMKKGIALKEKRVAVLDDLHSRMLDVIEARAIDLDSAVAGGNTGLIIREVTYLPSGATRERYEVDTGLLDAIRKYQEQAAKELGQWVEKVAPTDPKGEHEYSNLTDEERANRIAAILDRARNRRVGQADNDSDAPVS